MNWNTVVTILIIVILIFLILPRVMTRPMGRGRPLEINTPPINIPQAKLSKSRANIGPDSALFNREGISFVTEKISIHPITQTNLSENHSVISYGDETNQQEASGLFEVHVFFSVHNWSNEIMNVYDIHSRLYHVSAGYTPLTIGYVSRYRVDLCSDNSIINSATVFRIEHGAAAYFELVFETGFYDDTGTTLAVFGLDVDFELSSTLGVSKWRIPSDNIYTIQHWGPPYGDGTKVYAQNMDAEYISAGYKREKRKFLAMTDSAAAQTLDYAVIYECLGKMLAQHRAKGLHKLS